MFRNNCHILQESQRDYRVSPSRHQNRTDVIQIRSYLCARADLKWKRRCDINEFHECYNYWNDCFTLFGLTHSPDARTTEWCNFTLISLNGRMNDAMHAFRWIKLSLSSFPQLQVQRGFRLSCSRSPAISIACHFCVCVCFSMRYLIDKIKNWMDLTKSIELTGAQRKWMWIEMHFASWMFQLEKWLNKSYSSRDMNEYVLTTCMAHNVAGIVAVKLWTILSWSKSLS